MTRVRVRSDPKKHLQNQKNNKRASSSQTFRLRIWGREFESLRARHEINGLADTSYRSPIGVHAVSTYEDGKRRHKA